MNKSEIEELLTTHYNLQKDDTERKLFIKWPSGIKLSEHNGAIVLTLSQEAISSNMQSNESAFEGWILALRSLVFKNHKFTVKFDYSKTENQNQFQHYQRFLTRLWIFDALFGRNRPDAWFELSDTTQCNYAQFRGVPSTLKCNVGKGVRNIASPNNKIFSEADLEFRLCKDSNNNGDRKCLESKFTIGPVYRQFPVGIFKGMVSSKLDTAINSYQLFPGKKACIDLVAESKDGSEFWIFELKKAGNNPLGIISELLFYSVIVRDIVAGKITPEGTSESDCYSPYKLTGKKIINACFLAPKFHPLLLDEIVLQLNNAFNALHNEDGLCPIVFRKVQFELESEKPLKISRVFP